MIHLVISLVCVICGVDGSLNENSIVGESEWDRKSRKTTAWICYGLIGTFLVIGFCWWWITG